MALQLSWKSTSNNLALTFTTPYGGIYGAYDDYYESSTPNARIPIHLEAASGTLQSGAWTFDITGKSLSGSESFTLIINTN